MMKNEKIIVVLICIIIMLSILLGASWFGARGKLGKLNTKIESLTWENNSLKDAIERVGTELSKTRGVVEKLRSESANIGGIVSDLGESNQQLGIGVENAYQTIEEADNILDSIFDIIGD